MKTILTLFILTLVGSCLTAREHLSKPSISGTRIRTVNCRLRNYLQNARPNFKRVDRNHDGSISPDEHEAFLKRSREPRQPRPLPEGVQAFRNLPYAGTDNPRQTLDLFLPKDRKKDASLPMIVYIHGGGWKNGSKESVIGKLAPYLKTDSFAVAAINYRLSGESIWPSQIHDCKAAIRWLKGNAKKYGFDPGRLAVWGNSAGGHLVAMMGVSGDIEKPRGQTWQTSR